MSIAAHANQRPKGCRTCVSGPIPFKDVYFGGVRLLRLDRKKIRIAEHIEVSWVADEFDAADCPNCGATLPARKLLEIDYRPPGKDYTYTVNTCARCGARFFDNAETMDYATSELIEMGWHVYQIQVGAGLWPIAAPLAQINKPPGARMLEIGGAYGFGLDFTIRARQWAGIGYDPSPLATFGAAELGLNTKQDYFTERDLVDAPYDVIIATEVIEHLPDPPDFLRLMFRALASDGVLLPMLSPGAHLVLQTAASLRLVLQEVGFGHVKIERSGLSLIAYASASVFEICDDPANSRAMYRNYLLERSGTTRNSDLLFGFAGRAMFEAVNDKDFAAAALAWKVLLPAARERFGIDLDQIKAMPEGAGQASLATLVKLMPLGLGMILYSRAMQQLFQGVGRAELLPLFRVSADSLDALQAALGRRSLRDGLSAKLRSAVETEIMLCRADARDADCVAAVTELARRDQAHIVTAWRVFIFLVNAAYFPEALTLQQAACLYAPPDELTEDLRRDACFTIGILALHRADWPRAVTVFAQLRSLLLQTMPPHDAPHHLFWPALRGEVVALMNLGAKTESITLLQQFLPAYPGAPEDLRQQLP
jgi:SAM-dependent methyltransferase